MFKYLVVWALPALLSCSSSDPTPPPTPPTPCTTSLSDFMPGCPPTYDGTPERLPACRTSFSISVRICFDLIAVSFEGGDAATDCYYDSSSHLLAGGQNFSAAPSFCGGTSSSISAGRTVGQGCMGMPAVITKNCSDGGP